MQLEILQPEDDVESNFNGTFCTFGLFLYDQGLLNIWPQHIDFSDFHTLRRSCTERSNIILMFEIQCLCKLPEWFSYTRSFSYGLYVIGLLSLHPSGVDTSAASIIALYFC